MHKLTEKQTTSLEKLYETFGNYSPENLQCCACCHDESYVETLKRTTLRSLTEKDLQDYFSSALYTCEGMDAFKYFLPRLFDVNASDIWELRTKLEYADWKNKWSRPEIDAVENHIMAEWISGKHPSCFEEYLAFFSFSTLLSLWKRDEDFLKTNLRHLVQNNAATNSCFPFFEPQIQLEREEQVAICEFLEKKYYDNIDRDPEYAERISQANDWFDWFEPASNK